ncbi:Serine/threonine phosphatase PPP [Mycetocola reblochoni REB411]|uniref:Serine/threonine phosphatase PPP n=1 Tax=Mycetocola reblochoni REB411 TaxID=1255698 RepID=A0A1R4JG57_9MICO|nr:Serine/threonine phosphatase PPP [Mycetocola reblochoni REB411]
MGRVRANNQDSGYAGHHLFVVADGMGGHAGGDVASAIALKRIIEADVEYSSAEEAEIALQTAIIAANTRLADTVVDHPELMGMGTTVDAIAVVGDRVAIAHIGDSRIYLYRDGEISQITTDHTFVQKLVDAGRITPEEALVHPRRSVLMRVLGDVDAHPEIDTLILGTKPGDRWLLCSDGLSGVVTDQTMLRALASDEPAARVGDRLLKDALDHGAPDNVTIVIYDVGEEEPDQAPIGSVVGSAARPIAFEAEKAPAARTGLLPAFRLRSAKTAALGPSHFEPENDGYYDELIEEDARRVKRRRITWAVGGVVAVLAIVLVALLGYAWTQSRYFVTADPSEQTVMIYRGIQQDLGPVTLSSEYQDTEVPLADLSTYDRQQVVSSISVGSLAEAQDVVSRLRMTAGGEE